MRKYRKQIITGLALALGIYIVVLLLMDSSGQFREGVVPALRAWPWWLLVPLSLFQLGAMGFRFLQWQYYLGVIDARDKISLKDSAIIFVSGFTMVVSPGKVAEVLKAVFLKMKTGVAIAVSAPVVIAERVVDGIAVIVTLVITLLIAGSSLALGSYRTTSEVIIYTSAGLLIFGMIAVQIAPLAYFALGIIGRMPLIRRLQAPLTEFYESSREVFRVRHIAPTTLIGLGVYLCSTIDYLLILWGFGLEITWVLFLQVMFMIGVASAIGALSFAPNGAGVTEVSNIAMLTVIVMPQNPELTAAGAAAAALLQGFFHKWFRVVVGAGVAFIYRKRLFTAELEDELAEMERSKNRKSQVLESV